MNAVVRVRLLVGVVWLSGGIEKLLNPGFPRQSPDSLAPGGFVSQVPPFFRGFVQDTVIPNAELLAQAARAGELPLGLALILGFLAKLAPSGGVASSGEILLSRSGVRPGTGLGAPEFITINVLMALLLLVVLFSPAAKRAAPHQPPRGAKVSLRRPQPGTMHPSCSDAHRHEDPDLPRLWPVPRRHHAPGPRTEEVKPCASPLQSPKISSAPSSLCAARPVPNGSAACPPWRGSSKTDGR